MRHPASSSAARILILLAVLVLPGCEKEREKPKNTVDIPDNAPDDESWNSSILFTDSSSTRARLQVGHARRYISRMETLLDSGVYVEFFDREGAMAATLVADSARVDDRTRDMVAYGAVHVQSDANQTTVDTDRLYWDNNRRLLHSDAHVRVVDRIRKRTIEGIGFESDESLKNYRIYRVSGRVSEAP